MRHLFLLSLAAVLVLGGCAKNKDNSSATPDPTPDVKAPPQINSSFSVKPNTQSSDVGAPLALNKEVISISVSSLEKEFLLQAQLIKQPVVAQLGALKSRVVAFRKRGDSIFLMEATQGHSVSLDLPQNLILARFPILSETPERISFDFNKGMSQIFISSDWRGQDFEGPDYSTDFVSVKVAISYIEEAKINDHNQLMIRQIVQAELPTGPVLNTFPIEAKYYLSPYAPSADFTPLKSKDFDRMGFFEVAPQINPGATAFVYAAKFNTGKPIAYHLSANTPAEYRQAVKDGVLYWNKAFGKNLVIVDMAPEGVVAPDINYNIVQWVSYDSAGGAYADGQMDPRTGEVLHAQVFFPSAFAKNALTKGRQYYRKNIKAPQTLITLAGFNNEAMCDYQETEALTQGLASALIDVTDEAKILKLSQDYVRLVIAHEVGHTLGLRHNFAGSLAGNYPLSKRAELFKSYVDSGNAPAGMIPSSSVMEYNAFEEAAIIGDIIAKGEKTLSYDEKVIQTLYLGSQFEPKDVPLFCTDSHASLAYIDCQRFDVGPSFIEYSNWSTTQGLTDLAFKILDKYIFAKEPLFGKDPVPFEKVSLDATAIAQDLIGPRGAVVQALTTDGKFIRVHRDFSLVNELNKNEVRDTHLNYVQTEVAKNGGFGAVFSNIDPNVGVILAGQVEQILSTGRYSKGIAYNGKPYEFSHQDLDAIRATVKLLAEKLPEALVKEDIRILSNEPSDQEKMMARMGIPLKSGRFFDDDLTRFFAKVVSQHLGIYLFRMSPEPIVADIPVPIGAQPGNVASSSLIQKFNERLISAFYRSRDWVKKQVIAENAHATSSPTPTATPSPDAGTNFLAVPADMKIVSVHLPKFFYPQEIRRAATSMLRGDRGLSITWGTVEKLSQARALKNLMIASLGGIELESLKLELMSEPALRWVAENSELLNALGGASGPDPKAVPQR